MNSRAAFTTRSRTSSSEPGNQRARRLRVAAAAELPRERVHVHVAGAAERHLHLAVAEVAEEQRHARAGDRARMLDDAVELLRTHVVALERAGAASTIHDEPVRRVHLERAERIAQQAQPPNGHRRVDAPVHLLRIDAAASSWPAIAWQRGDVLLKRKPPVSVRIAV